MILSFDHMTDENRELTLSITDLVIFSRELFFYPSKTYLFIDTQLFENLKVKILKSIITWSEMVQQTAQSKKVYSALGRELRFSSNISNTKYCV